MGLRFADSSREGDKEVTTDVGHVLLLFLWWNRISTYAISLEHVMEQADSTHILTSVSLLSCSNLALTLKAILSVILVAQIVNGFQRHLSLAADRQFIELAYQLVDMYSTRPGTPVTAGTTSTTSAHTGGSYQTHCIRMFRGNRDDGTSEWKERVGQKRQSCQY